MLNLFARTMSRMSMGAKFGLLVGLILTVVFTVTGLLLHDHQKRSFHFLLEERAQTQLNIFESAAVGALFTGDEHLLDPFHQFGKDEDLIHLLLVDQKNRRILELGKPPESDAQMLSLVRPIRSGDEVLGEARLLMSTKKADRALQDALLRLAVIGVIALATAVVLTYGVFGRLAGRPVASLAAIATAVARGDLTQTMVKTTGDEIGQLATSFNLMVADLRQIVLRLIEAVQNTTTAANQISSSTSEQERTIAVQAASINEISTTMKELAQSSNQVGKTAEEVSEQWREVLQATDEGNRAVRQGVEEMSLIKSKTERIAENIMNLNEQIQKISSIVYTVASIAEQTNMLALNAAIEAARAGEHGRGFAVVATEVRKLADQSQKAAAQIEGIIQEIQAATQSTILAVDEGNKGVETGVKQVLQAGETIQRVTATIKRTVEAVREISSATRQQALGVDLVSETMRNIDHGMSETVAGTKQVNVTASQMVSLGHSLQELVQKFKLAEANNSRN
jgi:methyl-accepting chemotaxis protein